MEHESFEDEETAVLMNEHYVNIKVDWEERPDVDVLMNHDRHGTDEVTVYLCRDRTCSCPITKPDSLGLVLSPVRSILRN